jgi:hypothetical protein
MDLAPYHLWIVWIHVVGVFLFLIGHGVSATVAWRLRTERDPVAVRTLLDFSRRSMTFMGVGLLIWLVSGILAGASGNYWTNGQYWIWASLVLAIVVIAVMTPMGRLYFGRVRVAVGIDEKSGAIDPNFVVDQAVLDQAIMSGRPALLASIGVGTILVLSWLMFFKPF